MQTSTPNGCGPSWFPRWLTWLCFGWFFEASCNKHDQGYAKGGDEIRRFECDWKFLQAMRRDIKRLKWYWRPLAHITAITFFVLVRLFGWWFFQYKVRENSDLPK